MNYLRNLLRRLWPFVTRREFEETMQVIKEANNLVHGRTDKLEYEVAELNNTIQSLCTVYVRDNVEIVWQTEKPKKKPSRKKPAKKGKKK